MNKLNHSSMKKTFLAAVAGLALAVSCTENTPWSPVGDHIRTRWAQDVSPSKALPEYPRPTMVRPEWKSLNGLWNYAITSSEAEEMPAPEGKILVPFCIESSLSGVGKTVGKDSVLWYERTFTVPRAWRKGRVLLHFDAVDWKAEVCLNGQPVTVHTGGYTRFSVDITPYLVPGKQHLTVRVTDGTDNDLQPRGKQVTRPGGIWYTSVTGIWQSVWMEPVPSAHITGYQADLDAWMLPLPLGRRRDRPEPTSTASWPMAPAACLQRRPLPRGHRPASKWTSPSSGAREPLPVRPGGHARRKMDRPLTP